MKVERLGRARVKRLGRVRVYGGAYAVKLEERAVERGMTVVTHKTVIKEGYSYDEVIGLSGPDDTWIRRRWAWIERRWAKNRLENNIDKIVQEEEDKEKKEKEKPKEERKEIPKTVFIMSFDRLIEVDPREEV